MRRASIWKGGAVAMLSALASLPAVAQAAAAAAPAPAPGAPGPKPVPNLPYDVTADHGEVFNEERRAVYTGNVVVIQGQDRLNTPKLTLFFAKKDPNAKPKTPAPTAATAAPSATSTFGKIERMEAEGPVYFNTPTQNAKGDHGTYLASDDTTTLIGNVVLVQNKDVSTGDKLVINRTTDHYTLFSNSDNRQRVRGVFYQDEPAQPAAPGAPPKPAKPPKPSRP